MKKINNNFLLISLACLPSISISLFYYLITNGHFFSDIGIHYDGKFILAAEQILDTGFYTDNYYLPLYPYFLAFFFKVFGTNLIYPVLFNILLHGATALMLANIAKNFNSKWFYPTLIFSSFWPHLIWRTTYIYAETLFIFLIVSSLFFLFNFFNKKKVYYLIASSLFLGFSLITKGSNILLIFVLPILLFFIIKKKITNNYLDSFKLVFIYIFIFICIISFQFLRIYKETGYFGYSYQTGNRLYSYIYPCLASKFGCGKKDINAVNKANALYEEEKRKLKVNQIENYYYKDIIQKRIAIKLINELEFSQIFTASFGGYLKLFFHNFTYEVFERLNIKSLHLSEFAGNIFVKTQSMINKIFKEEKMMIIWLIAQLFLFLSRFVQLIGFINLFNLKNKVYKSLLLLIFFIPILFPVLSLGTFRYRAPLEPFLIILTISGLFFIRKVIYKKKLRLKNKNK